MWYNAKRKERPGEMAGKRTYRKWSAVRREKLVMMDLKAIREVAGKTQEEVAEEAKIAQSEVSRLERREDFRLSTLRRFVEACGGELYVIARFGDHAVRLRGYE